jgi:hypothetical protein
MIILHLLSLDIYKIMDLMENTMYLDTYFFYLHLY